MQGVVNRGEARKFTMEVEAKSEKHARELLLIKIGAKEGTEKSQIEIIKVEVIKGEK